MKKRLLLVFVLILMALLAFAACSSDIEEGEIDVDPEILDKLPCAVEVEGLEGVSGTANVQFVDETAKEAALTAVKEIVFVDEGATTYAVDISITKDGEEITVGKPVTVSIELKAPVLPLDRYAVYHIHNGTATEITPTVDGNKLTFTVTDFSVFMVVPKHVHTVADVLVTDRQPTCTAEGEGHTVCTACGATVESGKVIPKAQHTFGEWRTEKPASCREAGSRVHVCSACNKSESEPIEKLQHDYEAWKTDAPATCGKAGMKSRTCKLCGDRQTETIPATGQHTPDSVWRYNAESGKEYQECTVCHTVLSVREPEKPHVSSPFVGVTLGFKGYNGAIYDYTVFPTSGDLNAFLSRVTISFFDDGTVSKDGKGITGASFEIYATDEAGGIDWAIFGTYSAVANGLNCDMTVTSYYDGKTGKYYHGYHAEKFPRFILEVNGGISINTDKGLYEVASYVSGYDPDEDRPVVAAKGSFFFEKRNNAPVRIADLPADTNADYYERFVDGKVYGFNRATGTDAVAFAEAYAGATVSFFAENGIEFCTGGLVMDGVAVEMETAFCGSYRIEETEGGYEITFYVSYEYMDGELIPGATDTFTVVYDAAADEFTLVDGGTNIVFAYSAGATPTHYAVPAAPDNWDAAKIAQAFAAVGAVQDLSMPKVPSVKTMTVGAVVDGKVTVTCVMARDGGADAALTYKRETVYRAFYDIGYVGSTDYYLTANSECKFGITYAESNGVATLTIVIERFDPPYPSEAIAAYLTEHSVTDAIIEFKSRYAESYAFNTNRLLITLRRDANAQTVQTALIDALTKGAGYTAETAVGGRTYYASANEQIVFFFGRPEDGSAAIVVTFLDSSVLPIREYPATEIAAYLAGTDDVLPPLSNASAIEYKFFENEGIFSDLWVYMPATVDGAAAAQTLIATLKAAGYKESLFAMYQQDRGFYITYDVLLSPDKEIGVEIFGYGGGAGTEYSYLYVNLFNLVAVEGETYVESVTTDYVGCFTVGETFNFTGTIVAHFDDGHTSTLSPYDFTFTEVDTSTAGEQNVTATYRGNSDLTVEFTVTVTEPVVMTGITLSDYRTEYYVGEGFEFRGTILRTYSDGSTSRVDKMFCDFSEVDMTTPGTKTITVSYPTANGNVFTATRTITVSERG